MVVTALPLLFLRRSPRADEVAFTTLAVLTPLGCGAVELFRIDVAALRIDSARSGVMDLRCAIDKACVAEEGGGGEESGDVRGIERGELMILGGVGVKWSVCVSSRLFTSG